MWKNVLKLMVGLFITMTFGLAGCGNGDSEVSGSQILKKSSALLAPASITKSKVYMGAGDDSFTISSSGTTLYGASGNDVVTIATGVTGVVLDQNVEQINLSGSSISYAFKQTGNKINVYETSGVTLILSVPVQGDADGTVLSFSDGSASALLSGGVIKLGNAAVSSSTAGVLTQIFDPTNSVSDSQAINNLFKQFSDLFASSLPSATNATLLGLYDGPNFMESGQNITTYLSNITTSDSFVGIQFTNISILSQDTVNRTATVSFDVVINGVVISDGPKPWRLIKKFDGKWYFQGNQRIADVSVVSAAEYYMGNVTEIRTGIRFNISDPGGGITQAVVTGNGLPASGITLNNLIGNESFTIAGIPYGNRNLYKMTNDTAIGTISDGDEYTVKLYKGSTLVNTYIEKLKKRPYLNAELTVAKFPVVTSPTLTLLTSFNGGSITINWTVPTGIICEWVQIRLENLGNTVSTSEGSQILPTSREKTLTITPEGFTVRSRWIWLDGFDVYGREVSTAMVAGS